MVRRIAMIMCGLSAVALACGVVQNGDDGTSDAGLGDGGSVDASFDATGTNIDAVAPLADAGPAVDAASANEVTVLVVDPFGTPISDASVTFIDPSDGQAIVATGSDGIARASLPFGGNVIAPGVEVEQVANGDLIHAGPGPAWGSTGAGYVQGVVPAPTEVDAATISAAMGNCSIGVGTFIDQVDASGAYGYPLAYALGQGGVEAQAIRASAGDILRCIAPSAHVGASFIARDPSGAATAIAVKSAAVSPSDAGAATNVLAQDFSTVAMGTETFSGVIPAGPQYIESRVDFPFEGTRYPGERRTSTLGDAGVPPFSFIMPPANAPQQMISQNAIFAWNPFGGGGIFGCAGRAGSMHVHRGPATSPITEDFDSFLPALTGNPNSGSATALVAPLPVDAIAYCGGHVAPMKKGTTAFPPVCGPFGGDLFPMVIASPALSYALARQYPTAIGDPDSLLALLSAVPSVDIYISFWSYLCIA